MSIIDHLYGGYVKTNAWSRLDSKYTPIDKDILLLNKEGKISIGRLDKDGKSECGEVLFWHYIPMPPNVDER